MRAPDLLEAVVAYGGVLTLKGDRIAYELPEEPNRCCLNCVRTVTK